MKLVIPVPPDWQQRKVPEGILLQAPGETLGIIVMPMAAAHVDPDTWVQQALARRTPGAEATPRNVRLSRFTADAGWGAVLLEGDVGPQARLVAYFGFLDYAATVIVICREPARMPGWRGQALALLAQAHPDFAQDGVSCLAHLLGMVPPRTSTPPVRVRSGWHRSFVGGDLLLTGDDGAQSGWIRISQQVRPVRPVAELFRSFEAPAITITAEGEYAAVASETTAGRQHSLGIVFGDEHVTRIESVVPVPEHARLFRATVEELTHSTTLGLGAGRWRRFYYEPPPGWLAIGRPRGELWISPSCPRQYQVMRVFDARPPADHRPLHGGRMFETLPHEFFVEPPRGPAVYYTGDDLECRVMVYSARLPNRDGIVKVLEGTVAHGGYVYPIRLECDAELIEDSMHVFERVIGSVRTIPEARADAHVDHSVLSYMVD